MPGPSVDELLAWLKGEVNLDAGPLQDALANATADGFAGGSLAVLQQLPDGANPGAAALFGTDAKAAWDEWSPGNVQAAQLLDNGGFKDLLDASNITIKGITDTTYDRMGSILADGAASGSSVDEIADGMYDVVGDSKRAFMIADTELARATSAASMDMYGNNGIKQWEWVLSPDACPLCIEQQEANPHSMQDEPPPLHPYCRCTSSPLDVPTFLMPEEPDLFPDLPRLDSPQGYDQAYLDANPGRGTAYRSNCHYVAPTMEMRARGYDVIANQSLENVGRFGTSISRDWVDSNGETRAFQGIRGANPGTYSVSDIEAATSSWPAGARGFISVTWNIGGGHIFNFYKDEDGVLKFVDGQVAKKDASGNLAMSKRVSLLRVDDLTPVPERINTAVSATLQPVDEEHQVQAAMGIYNQYLEDMRAVPAMKDKYRDQLNQIDQKLVKLGAQVPSR